MLSDESTRPTSSTAHTTVSRCYPGLRICATTRTAGASELRLDSLRRKKLARHPSLGTGRRSRRRSRAERRRAQDMRLRDIGQRRQDVGHGAHAFVQLGEERVVPGGGVEREATRALRQHAVGVLHVGRDECDCVGARTRARLRARRTSRAKGVRAAAGRCAWMSRPRAVRRRQAIGRVLRGREAGRGGAAELNKRAARGASGGWFELASA